MYKFEKEEKFAIPNNNVFKHFIFIFFDIHAPNSANLPGGGGGGGG